MRGREAVTERVAASQAKRDWSKVINRAFSGEVRFVVEKHGTPVAGIVSADDVARLEQLDAEWAAEAHEVFKAFGRAFRDQTPEQIEEAVAQAVAEVRAENRRGAERRHGRSAEGR
ncbi:MAG: type II toxin-antitoxin system prevent-host-death family antitoxin [Chloroflexota bacterium]|nr:type II toxin-antitoxin system prevent-host-death family antitoxin [Chloroflexota bacterium]